MSTEQIFQSTFRVRFDECDPSGRLDPVSLLSYLLETATGASDAVDRGPSAMRERGLAWFLHRLHLQIDGAASHRHQLTVRTWPHGLDRLFAIREVEARGLDGQVVARATTRWMVVDLERRRLIRLPEWVKQGYLPRTRRVVDDPFDPLPRPEAPDQTRQLEVLRYQLDPNGHANATVYAGACLEGVPRELAAHSAVKSLELEFKKEAAWGDALRVDSATAPEDPAAWLHTISRQDGGEVVARGRSRW